MLRIQKVKHLAQQLKCHEWKLRDVAENSADYCEELLLVNPAKPNKNREVLNTRGELRRIQYNLYKNIFLPNFVPSSCSYGGIRGRSIKMNAERHAKSPYAFTVDVSSFYPSIHYNRVYRFFAASQGCSPDVARILTSICTHNYHLALGLVTSPIIADQILKPIDLRLDRMASKHGLVYTRYVDDVTVSGGFDFVGSNFPVLLSKILGSIGFKTNSKRTIGRIAEGEVRITNLRIKRGRVDVAAQYLDYFFELLHNLSKLAIGGELVGQYHTETQMRGRLNYICWINPGRKISLLKQFRSTPWRLIERRAQALGLVECKKRAVSKRSYLSEKSQSAEFLMASANASR